jgi:ketosteroid isomerase-like protein
MKKRLVFLTLAAVVLAVVAASAEKKSSSDEDAIRAADQGWEHVFGMKDLKASVGYCADDGSFMPPNSPIATGKEAIGQVFAGFFAIPDIKLNWHPTKIGVARSGELGYSAGVYVMSFKDPSGKTVNDRGKYVTVWKKQSDGSWKVVNDIFNFSICRPHLHRSRSSSSWQSSHDL